MSLGRSFKSVLKAEDGTGHEAGKAATKTKAVDGERTHTNESTTTAASAPNRSPWSTENVVEGGVDGLSLNPLAKEFVPVRPNGGHANGHGNGSHRNGSQRHPRGSRRVNGNGNGSYKGVERPRGGPASRGKGRSQREGHGSRKRGGKREGGSHQGNGNGGNFQRADEDSIKRTVYICDVDQQVTEAQLASIFIDSGPIVDCRVCGDPNSVMRFAFIEFDDEESAKNALVKNGTVLGLYPLRVLPSRTAIVPVNLQYLPQSYEEREQCGRTVYIANIDKKVDRNDVRAFFETLCGRVSKLRLLGDYQHATRIAFIEFFKAESAIAALNCSGALLGSLPIRVSPSKTPVRPDPRDGAESNQGKGKNGQAEPEALRDQAQAEAPASSEEAQQQGPVDVEVA
ncbi:RNA binding protein [Chloropicon primus]|uniref:RNA binding protein n=3 Tax=Chloropicon primus TaxID=1764295 RepID=A0A5B8MDT2_9CHLO|nr:RNA binding protein [Chloropicon primus]UPQ97756.1 RNA binding protein [Chloropicon primus]|eukprot:QDZ18547.1 RNA binding protein [Chloropicon primus]